MDCKRTSKAATNNITSPTKDFDEVNCIQSYVSFSYKKKKPYLSVYLESMETGSNVIQIS